MPRTRKSTWSSRMPTNTACAAGISNTLRPRAAPICGPSSRRRRIRCRRSGSSCRISSRWTTCRSPVERIRRVRGSLIAAALLAPATYCGNAQAQTPSDVTGRTPDLNIRIVDLVTGMTDLNFAVQDLRFAVVARGGKPVEMAGKTEALNVKETATEIRIEISADVLFDFDRADIRQDAAIALHQVADIIHDKGRGRAVRIEGHTDAKGSDAYIKNSRSGAPNPSGNGWCRKKGSTGRRWRRRGLAPANRSRPTTSRTAPTIRKAGRRTGASRSCWRSDAPCRVYLAPHPARGERGRVRGSWQSNQSRGGSH